MAYLQPKNMRVGSFLFSDNNRKKGVPVPRTPRMIDRANRHNSKYKANQEPDTPPTIIERQQGKRDEWAANYDFELAN